MQLKTDGRNGEGFGGKNIQKSKTGGAENQNAPNSNAGNRALQQSPQRRGKQNNSY